MTLEQWTKDPDDRLDWAWPFRDPDHPWLQGAETITAHEVVVEGPDAALTVAESSTDGETVTVWLAGGTLGADYTVTVRATTSAGRIVDRSIRILCRTR